MTAHRLAYDDAATTSEMCTDAAAAGRVLRLLPQGAATGHRQDLASPGAPVVPDDLAALAASLELHLG